MEDLSEHVEEVFPSDSQWQQCVEKYTSRYAYIRKQEWNREHDKFRNKTKARKEYKKQWAEKKEKDPEWATRRKAQKAEWERKKIKTQAWASKKNKQDVERQRKKRKNDPAWVERTRKYKAEWYRRKKAENDALRVLSEKPRRASSRAGVKSRRKGLVP